MVSPPLPPFGKFLKSDPVRYTFLKRKVKNTTPPNTLLFLSFDAGWSVGSSGRGLLKLLTCKESQPRKLNTKGGNYTNTKKKKNRNQGKVGAWMVDFFVWKHLCYKRTKFQNCPASYFMGKVGRWGLSRLSPKSTTFINAAAILNLLTPSNKAKYAGFDKCGFTQINGDIAFCEVSSIWRKI